MTRKQHVRGEPCWCGTEESPVIHSNHSSRWQCPECGWSVRRCPYRVIDGQRRQDKTCKFCGTGLVRYVGGQPRVEE